MCYAQPKAPMRLPVREDSLGNMSEYPSLSKREKEVVHLIYLAQGNAEIAAGLSISKQTVKNHLYTIFRKLGVFNRVDLAIYAMENLPAYQIKFAVSQRLASPVAQATPSARSRHRSAFRSESSEQRGKRRATRS